MQNQVRKFWGMIVLAAMAQLLPLPVAAWSGGPAARVKSENGKYAAVLEAGRDAKPGRVTVYDAGGTSKTLWTAVLNDESGMLGGTLADDGRSLATRNNYYAAGESGVSAEVKLPQGHRGKLIVLLVPLMTEMVKNQAPPDPMKLTCLPEPEGLTPVMKLGFRGVKAGAYKLMVRLETSSGKGVSVARVREVPYFEVKPNQTYEPLAFDFSQSQ